MVPSRTLWSGRQWVQLDLTFPLLGHVSNDLGKFPPTPLPDNNTQRDKPGQVSLGTFNNQTTVHSCFTGSLDYLILNSSWLPFWESFLILGLVNNLGDGSSLTSLDSRPCVLERVASFRPAELPLPTWADWLPHLQDNTFPKTVFIFFLRFLFWLFSVAWNSRSLSLNDSSLGTRTLCLAKLVDTALCHLNKNLNKQH